MRRLVPVVAAMAAALTLTGCEAYDLPLPGSPVDDDHSYQVWLVDAAGQESASVMDPGDSSATMWIEGLGDTEVIGVTEEPAGGSTTPTLPMVADVALPA